MKKLPFTLSENTLELLVTKRGKHLFEITYLFKDMNGSPVYMDVVRMTRDDLRDLGAKLIGATNDTT